MFKNIPSQQWTENVNERWYSAQRRNLIDSDSEDWEYLFDDLRKFLYNYPQKMDHKLSSKKV